MCTATCGRGLHLVVDGQCEIVDHQDTWHVVYVPICSDLPQERPTPDARRSQLGIGDNLKVNSRDRRRAGIDSRHP